MSTKLAQKYDIESIMSFVKKNSNPSSFWSEESLEEYKATILEHILRKEAFLVMNNNKIVGLNLIAE